MPEIVLKAFDHPVVCAYGGGVNSTAMIILLTRLSVKIAAVLFADTGSEKPETYKYLEVFGQWLSENGQPPITVVQYQFQGKNQTKQTRRKFKVDFEEAIAQSRKLALPFWIVYWQATFLIYSRQFWGYSSLGEECIVTGVLPSKAYGHGKCSAKWKVEPQQAWLKENLDGDVIQCIGIHAGEQQRLLLKSGQPKPSYEEIGGHRVYQRYPLVEADLYQDHCTLLIEEAGLPVPMKSACWFCPSSKPKEIVWLKKHHPDLYEDALYIEENAAQYHSTIQGLGRKFAWRDVGKPGPLELLMIQAEASPSCPCID